MECDDLTATITAMRRGRDVADLQPTATLGSRAAGSATRFAATARSSSARPAPSGPGRRLRSSVAEAHRHAVTSPLDRRAPARRVRLSRAIALDPTATGSVRALGPPHPDGPRPWRASRSVGRTSRPHRTERVRAGERARPRPGRRRSS
ncbi:hypothetical protein HBB16_09725 [Pseudonocardia sp. MCCB 268]|nr:hypothetical protein [Pseudonocardia cytotoxica]